MNHWKLWRFTPRILSALVIGLLIGLVTAGPGLSDTPNLISYQGRLTNPSGSPLDGSYSLTFRIYNAAAGGSVLWDETHSSVPVVGGLFSVMLGSVDSDLRQSHFADTGRYLGISVSGGPELTPRTRFVSMPYAYRAATVDSAAGGTLKGSLKVITTTAGGRGSLLLLGTASDSVMLNYAEDVVLRATHKTSGETVMAAQYSNDGCHVDFYDPVNVRPLPAPNLVARRVTVGNPGLEMADQDGNLKIEIRPTGDIVGRSRLTMGTDASATGSISNAIGFAAKAANDGSIVMAANTVGLASDSVRSGADEQMVLRADGLFYLTRTGGVAPYDSTKFLNTSTGAYLTTTGTWTNNSDRNRKENITEIDGRLLLEQLAQLPVSTWNYKGESPNVRHIGPMAQDFHRVFQVGADSLAVTTIDPSGVALAAVKELKRQVDELRTQNQRLEAIIEELASHRGEAEPAN